MGRVNERVLMLLDDPICIILMESDRTSKDDVLTLIESVNPLFTIRYTSETTEWFDRRSNNRRKQNITTCSWEAFSERRYADRRSPM